VRLQELLRSDAPAEQVAQELTGLEPGSALLGRVTAAVEERRAE
jgi:hypothetical protein